MQTMGECLVSGLPVAGLDAFDQAMITYMTARGISAGTLAVSHEGRLVYARGFNCAQDADPGAVDPVTRFRIASISKPITSVAILRLARLGALRLDDKAVQYVDLNPQGLAGFDPRINEVTIANLLDHKGGWDPSLTFEPMFYDRTIAAWAGKELPISQEDIIGYMAAVPLSHDPGTTYVYSNYGFMLLGRVIEGATGEDYETHVKTHVLAPAGATVMELGRSLKPFKARGEARYRSQYEGTSVFTQEPVNVESPYGAFNLENMDAHGGWIATAPELCRVADVYEEIRAAAPGAKEEGGKRGAEWGYFGSLPGTTTFAFHGAAGLSMAALFNQRDDASGLEYINALYDALMEAAAKTSAWPEHDLFPVYLGKLPQTAPAAGSSLPLLLNEEAR